jgi:SAM-dependent methyltransferase
LAEDGSFSSAFALAQRELGSHRWRVLILGAGCLRLGLPFAERGHGVVAADVSLGAETGRRGGWRESDRAGQLTRVEAEMDSLPFEPASFDLIVAEDALHHATQPARSLIELRRVTRRGGLLLVFKTPVFRRRRDGEERVARERQDWLDRYGVAVPRESEAGYLLAPELRALFAGVGWRLEVHQWPGRLAELLANFQDLWRGRRRVRFPLLAAWRDD